MQTPRNNLRVVAETKRYEPRNAGNISKIRFKQKTRLICLRVEGEGEGVWIVTQRMLSQQETGGKMFIIIFLRLYLKIKYYLLNKYFTNDYMINFYIIIILKQVVAQ